MKNTNSLKIQLNPFTKLISSVFMKILISFLQILFEAIFFGLWWGCLLATTNASHTNKPQYLTTTLFSHPHWPLVQVLLAFLLVGLLGLVGNAPTTYTNKPPSFHLLFVVQVFQFLKWSRGAWFLAPGAWFLAPPIKL